MDPTLRPWATPTIPDLYVGPQPHPLSIMAGKPWPKSYEDLAPLLDGPLVRQPKAFERRFKQVLEFRDEKQDKIYAQLAILAEFWRLKQAMDEYSAEQGTMCITSIPMCPYDYEVSLTVAGGEKLSNQPWWRRKQGDHSLVIPTVFPKDILGYGARELVDHGQITAQSMGRRYIVIYRDVPLTDQVELLFGPQYAQDLRHHQVRGRGAKP